MELEIVNMLGALVPAEAVQDKKGEWVVTCLPYENGTREVEKDGEKVEEAVMVEGDFVKFPKCTAEELAELVEKHNAANLKEEE